MTVESTLLEIFFMATGYICMGCLLWKVTRLLGGLQPPVRNTEQPYAIIDGKEVFDETNNSRL